MKHVHEQNLRDINHAMNNQKTTQEQLVDDIARLRQHITELEQENAALREGQQRYRLVIENIPTVVWVSDQEGNTTFISDNVEKVYGYTPKEIKAGGEALWFDRIHAEDQRRVREAYARLFSERIDYNIEYRIQRKDGVWIWLLDRANLVEESEGELFAYGIFSDITDAKQVEEALQLFTDRLKILYQINQGILVAQSPAEIAQVALRWIRQLIPCQRAGVTLYDPGANQVKLIALDVGGKTEFPSGTYFQLDQIYDIDSMLEQLDQGRIVTREVYPVKPLFKSFYVEGLRTFTYVPLIYEGDLIGTLNLSWVDTFKLTNIQEEIAREVAAQLSIAIRQTQLLEAEHRRRKELELLERVSTALRYVSNLEDLFNILVDEFKILFGTDAGAILVSQNTHMNCVLAYGSAKQIKQFHRTKKVIRVLSDILYTGQPRLILDQEFGLQGVSSVAILPFQSQQNILGGAVLCWRNQHEVTQEEFHLLSTVADVAGIALHRMNILETLEQQVANRTRELSALYEVTSVASRSLNLQEILDHSLIKVLEAMISDIGIILLLDEPGEGLRLASCQGVDPQTVQDILALPRNYRLAQSVLEQQEPVVVQDLASDPRAPELAQGTVNMPYAGVPIRVKDRILGVLSVIGREGSSYNEDAVSLLTSIADQIGIAIENAQLYGQAQQVAILTERQRLARDLHDSVTQSLYSLNLMATTGQRLLESGGDKHKINHTFNRLGTTAHQALKDMRLLVYELRPSSLEKEGFVGALRHRLDAVEGRSDIEVRLIADPLPELPPYIEDGLYLISQEALNNALKHSGSSQTEVSIRLIGDILEMEIRDYGAGFVPQEPEDQHGMGLTSMKERARIIGADLAITSEPGRGTCVRVRVKVNPKGAS